MRFAKPMLLAALVLAGGCTTYYKVTDPTTGKVYYTEKLDQKGSGAVVLKDAATGGEVSLQNSEVTKVNKETYEANFATSGKAPAAPAAPAAK